MKNCYFILIFLFFSNLSVGEEKKEPNVSALDKELFSILRSQRIDPECKSIISRVQFSQENHKDIPLKKIEPFYTTVGAAFALSLQHKLANYKSYTSRIENLFPNVIEICNKNSDFKYIRALELAILKAELNEMSETIKEIRRE